MNAYKMRLSSQINRFALDYIHNWVQMCEKRGIRGAELVLNAFIFIRNTLSGTRCQFQYHHYVGRFLSHRHCASVDLFAGQIRKIGHLSMDAWQASIIIIIISSSSGNNKHHSCPHSFRFSFSFFAQSLTRGQRCVHTTVGMCSKQRPPSSAPIYVSLFWYEK